MPTAIRRRILRYLFENGVMVVSDNQTGTHEELDCLNIYPFQIGRSFVSKGFCVKSYAWAHAYYTLTDKGIEYLRNFFGLPANAAPATLRPSETKILESRRGGDRFGRGRRDGGRPPRRDGERRERGDRPPRRPRAEGQ